MPPAQPLQSRLFWRIAAGIVCAVLISLLAVAVAGPAASGLTIAMMCGTAAGLGVAYRISRQLARTAHDLADGIRDLGQRPLDLPDADSPGNEFVRIVDALESTDERLRERFA
ncbi:MAG: hypothetical protein ACF8TS_04150 [Maioricimonas sp. JB049]